MARFDLDDVWDAYRLLRRQSADLLTTHPFATTHLITPFVLDGDTPTLNIFALRALLTWAANQLRPAGPLDWGAYRWRHYTILYHYYLRGESVDSLTERFGITDPTFWKSVRRAIERVAPLALSADCADPIAQQEVAATLRYDFCDEMGQRWLRLLSIFSIPLPQSAIQTHFPDCDLNALPTLQQLNTVEVTVQGISIHPALCTVAATQLTAVERNVWHVSASDFATINQRPAVAVEHLLKAGEAEKAAQLLLEEQEQLLHDADNMRDLLRLFGEVNVSAETWFALCLLTGRVAERNENVGTAQKAYLRALGSADFFRKATAYFHLARLSRNVDIDAAIHHFERCITLLTSLPTNDAQILLARATIRRAMIFLQTRIDLARAKADLEVAQAILERFPIARLQSTLHNGWAIYHHRQRDFEAETPHRWQAWQMAHEAQDTKQIVDTAHNLGLLYARRGRFEQAIIYLNEAHAVAEAGSLHQMIGLCQKHLGGCYFGLGQYDKARHQYEAAHDHFAKMGLKMWQANTCYDLSEVLLLMQESAQARVYFEEGQQLCAMLGLKNEAQMLEALGDVWREISADLTPRQRTIINYV